MIINKESIANESFPRDSPPHTVQGNRYPQQAMEASQVVEMARVEDPPPYPHNYAASISAPNLLQPSSTSRTTPLSPPPKISVNYLYMRTRHEPINGMYHIDPEIDTIALKEGDMSTLEQKRYNHKHQQRHRHHKRKGLFQRVELPEPNAIFETRQGAMKLDLGIVAGPAAAHSRALVQVATRQGSIHINVLTVHTQRHLNMEVSSRKGNIHILIPRSFSGYIQLYSRNGDLKFLPRLSSAMQLVYRRDKEMQVVVGRPIEVLSPEKTASWTGNTIHVSSRHGNIVLGFLGDDTIPPEDPGFWKKLAEFFHST